ncbi:MULE transposase [Hirsutella rhossiliensis]
MTDKGRWRQLVLNESADESSTQADLLGRTEEQVLEYSRCPSSLVVKKVFEEATNTEVLELQTSEQDVKRFLTAASPFRPAQVVELLCRKTAGSPMREGQIDCRSPLWDTGSMAGVVEGILKWRMPFSLFYPSAAAPDTFEYFGYLYRDGYNSLAGERNMVLQSGLEVVQVQGSLGGQQAEEFSRLFRLQNDRLIADFQAQVQSRALLPPELPEVLHSPGLKRFKSHGSTKRRSMTGREAAEHTAARADGATSDLLKGVDQLPDPSSTPSSPLATSPQLLRETRRSRTRSTKDIEKATTATGKSPDRAGKARKGEEPDMPKPRCKKRKASKEDETQLELQQRPTQDCCKGFSDDLPDLVICRIAATSHAQHQSTIAQQQRNGQNRMPTDCVSHFSQYSKNRTLLAFICRTWLRILQKMGVGRASWITSFYAPVMSQIERDSTVQASSEKNLSMHLNTCTKIEKFDTLP